MKILELFKGGGSITRYYKDNKDVEVISLDILQKYNPTFCCDILDWNFKQYTVGTFDIIWASPECSIFSPLQRFKIGNKWKDKNELEEEQQKNTCYIERTFQIINYLKPKYYFIENPLHSSIWNYVDQELNDKHVIVDYCRFGTLYKKPTKILTNKILDDVRCVCETHSFHLGKTSSFEMTRAKKSISGGTTLLERYSIPQPLLKYLLEEE
jgi:hypothetical protein